MAKKIKLGASILEVIDEIKEEPMSAAFGGKATVLTYVVKAVERLIDLDVEAVSPTKFTKILHAINRDGNFVLYEPEDEEDEDDEEEPWERDELEEMSAGDLRETAKDFSVRLTPKRGGKSGRMKKAEKVNLIDAIMAAQAEYFGLEEDEDEDGDVEEDEDGDEEYEPWTRKDLNNKKSTSVEDLLDIAESFEIKVSKKRRKAVKKDRSWIVDQILEAQGEDEGEDEDDEDVELYTKAELGEMSKAELVEIADEWELEVKKPTVKSLVKAILKFQKEELG